jgi:hypothetical protein
VFEQDVDFYVGLLDWLGKHHLGNARRLANHVQGRLEKRSDDEWDIVRHGTWRANLEWFAGWLLRCELSGPYTAPSWGRGFCRAVRDHLIKLEEHAFDYQLGG